MAVQFFQPGSGATRDLALLFLVGDMAPKLAAAIGQDACVITQKADTFAIPDIMSWSDALAYAQEQTGGFSVGHVLLAGFSAGCQGVRAMLNDGAPARVILAADGIHLSKPTPAPYQVDAWRAVASSAEAGKVTFSVSMSKTPAGAMTTRESAAYLFNWNGCMGSYERPCVEQRGSFRIYGATHNCQADPATEHMDQLRVLLPRMIADAKSGASVGGWKGLVGLGAAALGWMLVDNVLRLFYGPVHGHRKDQIVPEQAHWYEWRGREAGRADGRLQGARDEGGWSVHHVHLRLVG